MKSNKISACIAAGLAAYTNSAQAVLFRNTPLLKRCRRGHVNVPSLALRVNAGRSSSTPRFRPASLSLSCDTSAAVSSNIKRKTQDQRGFDKPPLVSFGNVSVCDQN